MEGISQFFDFNQANSSTFFTQKRHYDGLEAPRNSLEFPTEASHGYHLIHFIQEDIPYSFQRKHSSTKWNNHHTSMKTPSDDELSNKSFNQHSTPGLIARLMGMDTLPSEIKSSIQGEESKDARLRYDIARKVPIDYSSNDKTPKELRPYCMKRDSGQHIKNPGLTKLQPRQHPQEELLQKFKKEFEAWQASRVWEHSLSLEPDNNVRHVNDSKILARENLKKEKMARYADAKKKSAHNTEKMVSRQIQPITKGDIFMRDRAKTSDTTYLPLAGFDKGLDRSSSPTRIVILKPCSEVGSDVEEGGVVDFLEEVKERLRYESQGKARTKGFGNETSSDSPSGPKQIRENDTRDIVSTRSRRSEIRSNGLDSPEFINRERRRLLSERLKNVLKNETGGGSGSKSIYNFSEMGKKVIHSEHKKSPVESKTGSFRREDEKNIMSCDAKVRGSEHTLAEVRKNRKDGFNLKDRISNLRHNLTLKGNVFRKKVQSVSHSYANEFDPVEPFVTAPSVFVNLSISQDNFTEVPPSPVSVASSSHDDFCRPGHPSPDSPLELPFMEDHSSLIISEGFSSEFHEMKSSLEKVIRQEEPTILTESNNNEPFEVEGHPESYVKAILITASLYEVQSFDSRARPIPNWVFEKVEEAYSRELSPFLLGDTELGHKMLFDLINETLLRVLGPSRSDMMPHGKQLLDKLLQRIRDYTLSPQMDESNDGDRLVAWDLKTSPWPITSHDDVEAMGREMECVIIGELIDEFVCDIICT